MTTPNIQINPSLTSVASGTFGTSWNGLIVGSVQPDPSTRFAEAGGFLASTEVLPMWAGVGISEAIPTPQTSPPMSPDMALGGPIVRALNVLGGANVGNLTGFSVINQNYSAINSPQSEVPMVGTYGAVLFWRLGTGARVALQCASSLSSFAGDPITQPVSWDYVNQMLVPYQASFAANTISAATWSAGLATLTTGTTHGISPGAVVTISGVVPAGYNGTFIAGTGTTASTLVVPIAANPGAYVSGGVTAAGGGALPVKILKLEIGNSMVPVYNSTTGFNNWNRAGNAALVLI